MKIRIVSPAKSISESKLEFAKGWLSSLGHEVEIAEHAAGIFHYFSGTDEERLKDLQDALDDPSVDAILCSRGGYGVVRIIDKLDFSAFKKHPKLVLGYSDITVLHNRITGLGIESIHTSAPLNFEDNTEEALDSIVNVLNNEPNTYQIKAHKLNRFGDAEAEVVGGNLSILSSLVGTNDDINTDGKILFIEDLGEAIYAVDRMMWTLKKSGKLDKLAGMIIGGMSDVKDSEVPFGKTIKEVIADAVEEYDFPVCFNFPAGHIDDNRAVVLGRKAKLSVQPLGITFSQD